MKLHIPTKDELWFKKEIKEDPKTMDYNAGYDVSFDGYDYNDGTIVTDIKELNNVWFPKWINNWPTNYYTYIKDEDVFVGEIYAKWDNEKQAYEIGVVIKAEYRGNGYASRAIGLLCKQLKKLGAKKLFHELPMSRVDAIKADINNGFKVVKEKIVGMKKFGKEELCVYLEKLL